MPTDDDSEEPRLGFRSQAMFHSNSWIEEGDGLLASARTLRAIWIRRRRLIRARKSGVGRGEWAALVGNPAASVLLSGYAVEMYLKAGLAKLLTRCPESTFARETKNYSHGYRRLANDLEIPEEIAPRGLLEALEKAVLSDARYPAQPTAEETYVDAINRRTFRLWSSEKFGAIGRLAARLRTYVQLMDGDEKSPSSVHLYTLENNGYVVFRIGGHLPSRVTFRPPEGTQWGVPEITHFLEQLNSIEVRHYWKQCALYLDDGRRLRCLSPGP